MPELGKKHECSECGAKFYDLGKPSPVCPRCGTQVAGDERSRASRRLAASRRRWPKRARSQHPNPNLNRARPAIPATTWTATTTSKTSTTTTSTTRISKVSTTTTSTTRTTTTWTTEGAHQHAGPAEPARPGPRPERAGDLFALALGANLDDGRATLASALERLGEALGPLRIAPLYRSAPVPPSDQPPFFNTAATGRTRLAPGDVLALGKALELAAGRRRSAAAGRAHADPRPLDVDLVVFGARVSDAPELTLPHPRLREPALRARAARRHRSRPPRPPDGKTVAELLAALPPAPPEEWIDEVPWT